MEERAKVWLFDLNNFGGATALRGPEGGGPLSALGPVGIELDIMRGEALTPLEALGPVGMGLAGTGDVACLNPPAPADLPKVG